ncbi:MAG: hypothetical protein ACNS60_13205 [Candidatus Cyclobacteriaceae bacterium M2_1C_046]
MINWFDFQALSLRDKISLLYREGNFITAIRYYGHKVNLYLLSGFYVEVFYNHKYDRIDRIDLLDRDHTRMKFYFDQIKFKNFPLKHE